MLPRFAISCLLVLLALPVSARTRPHYGGTLRVEIDGEPWPQNVTQRTTLARRLVFDGLTRMDADGSLLPALALRWASENNDHRWQFWLRPGVHFHDGSVLTASIVETALTSSCGAACPWTDVHAVGATLVFTSDSPMPNLPALLAGDDFLIGLAAPVSSDLNSITGPSIGTGPFQFGGLSNGILTLAANGSCWQGRPFIDKIEIHGNVPVRDQWLDLSVGRADLVEVPPEQLRQAQQQRLTVVSSHPAQLLALAVADSGALG